MYFVCVVVEFELDECWYCVIGGIVVYVVFVLCLFVWGIGCDWCLCCVVEFGSCWVVFYGICVCYVGVLG